MLTIKLEKHRGLIKRGIVTLNVLMDKLGEQHLPRLPSAPLDDNFRGNLQNWRHGTSVLPIAPVVIQPGMPATEIAR